MALRSWVRLGNDWTASQGKPGKPNKQNVVSRTERARILKSMPEEKMQPCYLTPADFEEHAGREDAAMLLDTS